MRSQIDWTAVIYSVAKEAWRILKIDGEILVRILSLITSERVNKQCKRGPPIINLFLKRKFS